MAICYLQICMGSGACVRVHVYRWGLNVYVDGIPADQGRVDGLCGDYNGNPDDDNCASNFCPTFNSLWKVPPEEDLFDVLPPEIPYTNRTKLCQCEDGDKTLKCGPDKKDRG